MLSRPETLFFLARFFRPPASYLNDLTSVVILILLPIDDHHRGPKRDDVLDMKLRLAMHHVLTRLVLTFEGPRPACPAC